MKKINITIEVGINNETRYKTFKKDLENFLSNYKLSDINYGVHNHGKEIGKMITRELDNGNLLRHDILNACDIIGVDIKDISARIYGKTNKYVGKVISKKIQNGEISSYPLEDELIRLLTVPEYTTDEDICCWTDYITLGKRISEQLENGLKFPTFTDILTQLVNIDEYVINDLNAKYLNVEYKRIGKNVTKLLKEQNTPSAKVISALELLDNSKYNKNYFRKG